MEGPEHFVPFEVPDDTEVDDSVFFFRVVGVAAFSLIGARGGAFAAARRATVWCKGWEIEVTAGGSRGRGRWCRWLLGEVWYFTECRQSSAWG